MAACVVFGGGGHARVLIDTLQQAGGVELVAILDRDSQLWGQDLYGVPIRGDDSLLPELIQAGVNCFIVGVGSLGDTRVRRELFALGLKHGLAPHSVFHHSAVISPNANFGRGVQVLAGAIINAGAVIGDNVLINTGAIVEHDCRIGDHVHVATGATLSGTVQIGEGAHIGAGAVVRNNISIGAGAIVGVGAAVVKDVPAETTVVGVPARPR